MSAGCHRRYIDLKREKRACDIPSQTGDGGEDVELRTANYKVDNHHHEDRASFGAGGFVQDLDDGVHGGRVGDFVEIAGRGWLAAVVVCMHETRAEFSRKTEHTQGRKEGQ